MMSHPQAVIFRPHRLRVIAVVSTGVLVAVTTFGWFALPADIRVLFSFSQRLTLLGVLTFLVGIIVAAAASFVRADHDGLRFRNGFRSHTVGWDRVHKILLRPGDPWAMVLIKPVGAEFAVDLDAEKRMLMGIQASDGPIAQAAVTELRRRQVS